MIRSLYLTLGLLLGMWFTTYQANRTIDAINKYYEIDLVARTLGGFWEGWDRGREYTFIRFMWLMVDCQDELEHDRKLLKELEQCGN